MPTDVPDEEQQCNQLREQSRELRSSSRLIARQLSATEGVVEVRVNTRCNFVAADAATGECLKVLVGLTQICGVPVHARLPADHNTSLRIIFEVDPNFTPEGIGVGIKSEVPITAIERWQDSGMLVKLAGLAPAYVCLWKLGLGVHACCPGPLQWTKCGRLDHATACCRGPARCALQTSARLPPAAAPTAVPATCSQTRACHDGNRSAKLPRQWPGLPTQYLDWML